MTTMPDTLSDTVDDVVADLLQDAACCLASDAAIGVLEARRSPRRRTGEAPPVEPQPRSPSPPGPRGVPGPTPGTEPAPEVEVDLAAATPVAQDAPRGGPPLAHAATEVAVAAPSEPLAQDAPEAERGSWPSLASLGLSAEDLVARSSFIGGSDATVILSGEAQRILKLWRVKRGEDELEDLSGKLAVMLGNWTEAFNRQWYEQHTGHQVTLVNEVARCSVHPWRRATLDGFVPALGAVWEAKHTSPFVKADEVIARYMPQLQHTMAVLGAERAVLSVLYGNTKWEAYEIAADWLYQADLLAAEQHFWHCVRSGEPPVALEAPPPPRPIGVREVCLDGNNRWATSAADWLQHRLAARKHAEATSALKELVEDDVARAFGHGVEARRSKAGALTIREAGQ